MSEPRLEYLFNKYISNSANADEEKEFLELVDQPENKAILQTLLQQLIDQTQPNSTPSPESEEAILTAIFQAKPAKVVPMKRFNWKRWSAAAVIIAIMATSFFLLVNRKTGRQIAKQEIKTDVAPGKEGAILTLENGKTIVLDTAANGHLAQQGNAVISKHGSQLSYLSSANDPSAIVFNTMSTPKGRQFSLVLADGSKVWLNAASSIKFPSAFAGNERKVEVSGEVYFEVAKNAALPFRVQVNDMTVEVMGTHFNINSYSDESSVTTTLLEGAVKVTKGDKQIKLMPGQRSVLDKNGNLTLNKNVNADEVVAWKDGYFHFESADLPTILRQFSRWYDVEISYSGQVSTDKFFVIMKRNSPLSSVLKALQASNVKFKIEGNKLMVQSAG